MPERRQLKPPQGITVKISPELQARLDACRPAGPWTRKCPLSEEQQAALVDGWPRLNHTDLCEALGVSKNTALLWYRRLTKKGDEIT